MAALAQRSADYLDLLKKGQIPPSTLSLTQLSEDLVLDGVKYGVKLLKQGQHHYRVLLNGTALDCVARLQADGGILLQVDGEKHVIYSEKEAMGIRLSIDSWTCLLADESDPSQVLAPSAGKINRYLVEDGTHLDPDVPYAELEVMKMLMPLLAPAAGTVHFQLQEGAVLSCGDLIATLELDDPNAILRAVVSEETFPDSLGPPQVYSDRIDDRFVLALQAATEILAGYEREPQATVTELLTCLDDRDLASLCWSKRFSAAQSRLPVSLKEQIDSIMSHYDNSTFDIVPDVICAEFPAEELLLCMQRHLESTPLLDRSTLEATLEPLLSLAEEHQGGKYTKRITQQLLEQYLVVEEKFKPKGDATTEQDIIHALREEYTEDLQGVLDLVVSRQAAEKRSEFVQQLLVHVVLPSPAEYRPFLRRLTAIHSSHTTHILKKAQYLLEESLLADLKAVVQRCLSGLEIFTGSSEFRGSTLSTVPSGGVSRKATQTEGLYKGLGSGSLSQTAMAQVEVQKMAMLVEAPAAVDDALALLLALPEVEISEEAATSLDQVATLGIEYRALMTSIKRMYHHQILQDPKIVRHRHFTMAIWTYEDLYSTGVRCHGAMVVMEKLLYLKESLASAKQLMGHLKWKWASGTFHVAVAGDSQERFHLFSEAESIYHTGSFHEDSTRDLFGQDERVKESLANMDPKAASLHVQAAIQAISQELHESSFETVNVLIQTPKLPLRKGYEWSEDLQRYVPHLTLRQVDAPVAKALELSKMEHLTFHYTPSRNRQWHIYTVEERTGRRALLKRLYLRALLHQVGGTPEFLAASYSGNPADIASAVIHELESTLAGCLEELLRVQHGLDDNGGSSVDWSHIFLALLPPVALENDSNGSVSAALRSACAGWVANHISSLRHACVAQIEMKIRVSDGCGAWRVVLSLPTGHETGEEHIDIYREKISAGDVFYDSHSQPDGSLAGQRVLEPYDVLSFLQQKRLTARRHGTTYCYDFPSVFSNALQELWTERAAAGEPASTTPHGPLVQAEELGFEGHDVHSSPYEWQLQRVEREPGSNRIGMVAWLMTLKSPEAPQGRQIVAVANDITFQSGAFGPKEDALFQSAVEYALAQRLPVVYLTANSGARIGLATDICEKLKVEWTKPDDPSKGLSYLYLEDVDYQALSKKGVEGSDSPPILAERNEKGHWMITDVIGSEDGIGVECLSGSGAIAGSFSKAFQQGFTITLVSGRTVGIGAYLARLGRRCVQSNQPIILTGYQALNKILGREVYSSQLQLGGPRVMGVNGVSHHIVSDDLHGIKTILKWLSYTPCRLGTSPSPLPTCDALDRHIDYFPDQNEKLDPRKAIVGWRSGERWISGLFDRGSWLEAQEGWAQTVVTGRARLGGIPIGVIAVETQTVFKTVPADPGMAESSEQKIPQAGQVWFPDSALKTAQAMEEFNLEGLPLIILANWRGFSGGQRDLFEGILQAGSLIVENLRTYKRPVFVYLPPKCELRGGAWVVIDSKINDSMVEMYADPSARGGVLETEGIVEIKFKKTDLLRMMHRLDPHLMALDQQGASRAQILEREQSLLPVYHQVALQFAEMHDTPKRMQGKGVLRKIVPWRDARRFLAQRLKRRLREETLVKQISITDDSISRSSALQLLKTWFLTSLDASNPELWLKDAVFQEWIDSDSGQECIAARLKSLRASSASRRVQELLSSPEGTQGLIQALRDASQLDPSFKAQLQSL